ncbi:MAG: methyltransferase domain-containing protein, partial [Pyrinomonadaceae bacterium]
MTSLSKADRLQQKALEQVRETEFGELMDALPAGSVHVLELGAGDGSLSNLLRSRGYTVTALDIPASAWADKRRSEVLDYNGVNIPLPNGSVDVVLSSNVMVHVRNFDELQTDIRRVLKPGGFCLHTLPTPSWRLWTTLACFPAIFRDAIYCPPKLGARARHIPAFLTPLIGFALVAFYDLRAGLRLSSSGHATFLGELVAFSDWAWKARFNRTGFVVEVSKSMGVFYTGFYLLGPLLSIRTRRRLAVLLGSSVRLYRLSSLSE